MLTAQEVKNAAIRGGADVCGIASVERFEGAPPELHPSTLFPEARSVIVFGSRILKGCYKGIQEGTDWSAYWIYGYNNGMLQSVQDANRTLCDLLEDAGHEAVHAIGMQTLLDEGVPREPGLPGRRFAPHVALHLRACAALAGLGEFGWSKVFLTPEFGPRQRFDVLVTDAVLEPDPLFRGSICDRCGACVRLCPGRALGGETEGFEVQGRRFEWGRVDCGKCKVTHWGLNPEASPFVRKDLPGLRMDVTKTSFTWYEAWRLGFAMAERVGYMGLISRGAEEFGLGGRPGSVCGAIGCIQACNKHLEAVGALKGGDKGGA